MNDGPIYEAKSLFKNGKRYELEEISWIFDCPYDEYIVTCFSKENAETALDMHYHHVHPSMHVPLITPDLEDKIERWFNNFRMRSFSPVGILRDAAK